MLISRSRWLWTALLGASLCRAEPAGPGGPLAHLALLDGASGYEGAVLDYVRQAVGGKQEIDNTGSLTATFGAGAPHTLLIAGLDEPGYLVSAITADGYLRVHRLSPTPPHRSFDGFFIAQPVRVTTAAGKAINGVVAALSVHLQSERSISPRVDTPEQMYVDIGARSEREARQAGVDILDPITLEKPWTVLGASGDRVSAPWISGRAGSAVLVELARRLQRSPPAGAVTLAFVSQQYAGNQGLARLMERTSADRVVWIKHGGNPKPAVAPAGDRQPQTADALAALAAKRKLDLDRDTSDRLVVPAFAKEEIFQHPERVATLTVGVEHAGTPVEVISLATLDKITSLLAEFAGIPGPAPPPADEPPLAGPSPTGTLPARPLPPGPSQTGPPPAAPLPAKPLPPGPPAAEHPGAEHPPAEAARATTLEALSEIYGVSGREGAVRQAIQESLPAWARRASRVDQKGNLIVDLGEKPERLFLSHMDELGFEVVEVADDGKLRAESHGGGNAELYEFHPGMVHTESKSLPAILLESRGGLSPRVEVDIGAGSAQEAEARGVHVGSTATIRKQLRTLLGSRANSRSFDDRIGCAVLVDTLRSLKREEIKRPTWFVFTVEEEVGLRGAEALAAAVHPKEVYPLDTFVSSDSPLESQRFAGARLGQGFVIRAMDSSGLTPRTAAARVADLARRHGIPVQYGVTSGANDGSRFVTGGAVNIPLGWPLRYSHSPAEVSDLADVDALRKIVRLLATE